MLELFRISSFRSFTFYNKAISHTQPPFPFLKIRYQKEGIVPIDLLTKGHCNNELNSGRCRDKPNLQSTREWPRFSGPSCIAQPKICNRNFGQRFGYAQELQHSTSVAGILSTNGAKYFLRLREDFLSFFSQGQRSSLQGIF